MCVPRVAKDDDLQQHLLARRHREAPGSCTDKATAHTSVIVLVPRRLQPTHAQVDKVQERRLQSPAPPARRAVATLNLGPFSCTPTLPRRHALHRHVAPGRQQGNSIAGVPLLRRAAEKSSSRVRAAARVGRSGPEVRRRSRPAAMPSVTSQTLRRAHLGPPSDDSEKSNNIRPRAGCRTKSHPLRLHASTPLLGYVQLLEAVKL
jgi:hypothetical protein